MWTLNEYLKMLERIITAAESVQPTIGGTRRLANQSKVYEATACIY
ncbi:hypothetical protein PanWU01x14_331870 [Parasponia andersonii]|uniref:Uncharacterized protein n=1 Tax=Parasponia andersonii TaxID=3476 RepID=A0A2P5AHH8_PARAD|nr:hypothetical protein PanWU01x14_331870 [Parasponia andersonii]